MMPDPLAIANLPNLTQALSDPLHIQNLPNAQQLMQALSMGEETLPSQSAVGTMGPEVVAAPAVRMNGQVFTGTNHGGAWENGKAAMAAAGKTPKEIDAATNAMDYDLWTTSHGRVIGREEALNLAKGAGQITDQEVSPFMTRLRASQGLAPGLEGTDFQKAQAARAR